MTTMTIKQAIQRVEDLEKNLEVCSNLAFLIKRDKLPRVHIEGSEYRGRWVELSQENLLFALETQEKADEAEIKNLQPVIEMANAALKGVLS